MDLDNIQRNKTHVNEIHWSFWNCDGHANGSVQDCGISSAYALEIPQPSTKPSIWCDTNTMCEGVIMYESETEKSYCKDVEYNTIVEY